jgi:hypothetical protein
MKTTNRNNQPVHPSTELRTSSGVSGKIIAILLGCLLVFISFNKLHAQTPQAPPQNVGPKQKAVVLNFDAKNVGYDPTQMGNLVRLELEKLDTFDVMDRYDVTYLVQKNNLQINNCYGKICLVELGRQLGADKMLTGSIEVYGDAIIYTMRFIDVKSEAIEITQVTEFLNMQNEIQTMTSVMLREMFGRPVDANVKSQLIKPDSYDARARVPVTERVRLDGPRMGATVFTDKTAAIISAPKNQGGFDAAPVMFQFGYQFEKQYLAAGEFQALFEFIPMVTGLDQGIFIPSFTVMNGMRMNRHGWEVGFGPTFTLITREEGAYVNNEWIRRTEYDPIVHGPNPNFINRLDSRGDVYLNSAFIFAVGKTFRSGNMNIPVNLYGVPGRDGWRVGISFGYNARNWYKAK